MTTRRAGITAVPDLPILSPGTRSDLEILLLEDSEIEVADGCLIVRSPLQPGFHWGNCLQVTVDDVESADRWVTQFHDAFPTAGWVAIGLPRMPHGDAWQRLGFSPEQEDVLVLRGSPEGRPCPAGYEVRPFTHHDDWDQLLTMDLEESAVGAGSAREHYVQFSRERESRRRHLMAAGRLAWMGAFTESGTLAASLGITLLGSERSLARYQSVLTHPDHRRRGLAAHLLGEAAGWAHARGAREFVIVTERANPAGRVYRSVGFMPTTPRASVYRAPTT